MENSNSSSSTNKRRGGGEGVDYLGGSSSRVLRRKKPRGVKLRAGLIYLKFLDVPLISTSTGCPCQSIRLHPDRSYTIGRNHRLCDFVFEDRRVSKQHCQIFFDSLHRRICISDGGFEFRKVGVASGAKVSLNGVFVNGARIGKGTVATAQLSAGDEVLLVCGNEGACSFGNRIGFVIQRIVFTEEVVPLALEGQLSFAPHSPCRMVNPSVFPFSFSGLIVGRANSLLSHCRQILHSDDPISYLRGCLFFNSQMETPSACTSRVHNFSGFMPSNNIAALPVGGEPELISGALAFGQEPLVGDASHTYQISENKRAGVGQLHSIVSHRETVEFASKANSAPAYVHGDHLRQMDNPGIPLQNVIANNKAKTPSLTSMGKENAPQSDGVVQNKNWGISCSPPGKKFYLNRLESMGQGLLDHHSVISLPELLYPVESLSRIFIATFTCDILWFLSYCDVPSYLPVTIVCHNTERCWSSSPDKRISVPYSDFPNLVVVYPPFPEVIAFGKDRKKQGIACHHPKLLVLQREDSIRVIITSANLVAKQWNSVTNTIWWQDFPRTSAPDCISIFTQIRDGEINQDSKSDFAAQLAGFMASLVIDVPSQAHWILELTKYDFGGAIGHLVASIPGIHFYRTSYVPDSTHFLPANQCASQSFDVKFLGSVEAFVVGLSHLFHTAADSNGALLKKLAAFLGNCCENAYGMSEIVLRRNTNIPADANAVSVLVSNPEEVSDVDCIQLGFLPRNVAKWVAPLWDIGFFRFSGYIYPQEAFATALAGSNNKVQLILYVSQGPRFSDISKVMHPEHVSAICSLIASIQRCAGLWRLQEVLGRHKWPDLLETDFVYGSSSIGSSVNAQFLAAFSAAAGKRSLQFSESEESDPEWGCWSASQESRNPSIRIIFPTIERVKSARFGILPSKRILCFSEKTWQRLRNVDILHDAIPHPNDRVGHPMHVKVVRRRFQSKTDAASFGWVYCGSHNFSPAAWGRPISNSLGIKANGAVKTNSTSGLRLHICNYELGIIFVVPPSDTKSGTNQKSSNLDDIILPFVVPAPKYGSRDRPATMQAMREALVELIEQEREKFVEATTTGEMMEDEIPDEEEEVVEASDYVAEEKEEEKAYAEILWSQVDSSES